MGQHPVDLVRRAVAAWKRRGAVIGAADGYCDTFDGRLHVIVREYGAAVSIYVVRADGSLRRVQKWPEAVW